MTAPAPEIRVMTPAELDMVLGWAAAEGWNPGLEDAPAFRAADPDGFLLGLAEGVPAAAISVVNHDAANAFLGLYICRPEFRGQRIGHAVWQAGMAHAGGRAVGLDGVPAQQENYRRSGFAPLGRTVRMQGDAAPDAPVPADTVLRAAGPADLPTLLDMDAAAAGHARPAYAAAWLGGGATRRCMVLERAGAVAGFAVFRQCGEGVKVGPFHARDGADARALLSACPAALSPGPLFVDTADGGALQTLLASLGFAPVFDTARMVRGTPPPAAPPAYYGVATLELG